MSARREAAVKAAVARLDMSQEAKDMLVNIWREVDEAYAEQVRDLKARLKAARQRYQRGAIAEAYDATDLRKNWRQP